MLRATASCFSILLAASCARSPGASPSPQRSAAAGDSTVTVPAQAPATAPAPGEAASGVAPSTDEPVITTWSALDAAQGRAIEVEGTVSSLPYQHMMPNAPDARHDIYLDLDNNAQVVVISPRPIECKKRIRIEGTVHEVSGAGKGGTGTHREPYVRAEKWTCIDP